AITGRVVDDDNHPVADVLVSATPVNPDPKMPRATMFATSGADGAFSIDHLAPKQTYELDGEVDGRASARTRVVASARDVTLAVTRGVVISGTVANASHEVVPAFTLTVFRREGAARALELTRSLVDASGHFSVHVTKGDIEVTATATGYAPSPFARIDAK